MWSSGQSPTTTTDHPSGERPVWTTGTIPDTSSDDFSQQTLSGDDRTAITAALTTVREARTQYAGEKKVLLFLGIGVGNPSGAWVNPSGSSRLNLSEQVCPPVLADAVREGFFVIGLNFNVAQTEAPPAIEPAKGIHLPVAAKFPLQATSSANAPAFKALSDLVGECDRIIVLNAVTDHTYPAPLALAGIRATSKNIKAAGCLPSVYAISYAQTGESRLFAPMTHGMAAVRAGGLTTVAQVFPGLDEVEG